MKMSNETSSPVLRPLKCCSQMKGSREEASTAVSNKEVAIVTSRC
jgi:hypothetical protein